MELSRTADCSSLGTQAKEKKQNHTLSTNHYTTTTLVVVCCSVYLSTRFNFLSKFGVPSELQSAVPPITLPLLRKSL